MRSNATLITVAALLIGSAFGANQADAADPWDPFSQLQTAPEPRKKSKPSATSTNGDTDPATNGARPFPDQSDDALPPGSNAYSRPAPYGSDTAGGGGPLPPAVDEKSRGVEKGELAPVIASDGTGLPYELWTGLDIAALEGLIAKVDIPPRSTAIHSLWRRLITANVTPPGGSAAVGNDRFDAVRADALYRSGLLLDPGVTASPNAPSPTGSPHLGVMAARMEIGLGNTAKGCDLVKSFIVRKADLPKKLQGEALLMTGICAAVGGNPSGAGLAAEFAREDKSLAAGPDDAVSLAALDAIASGQKSPARGLKSVSLLQYRAFALAGGIDPKDATERGEPALLAALAADKSQPPAVQLLSGEAAARINAFAPMALADLYRAVGTQAAPEALLASGAAKAEAPLHRAALFKAAEAERTPLKKVRIMRALLDDAKRADLYLPTLAMLSRASDGLQPVPEIGWFAETGIEIALASGNLPRARQWANLGGSTPGDGGLRHWQALVDIADPALKAERGRALVSVEELATRGRLSSDLLHRLATVLDANDINVPIPLWDAANRAPQPTGGFLPETGILTSLQDASKKREFGRTVLLVMRALGPTGAEGAHLIAVGDSIRALRRAGLEDDARRLSFEALFALWPRSASN